MDAFMKRYPERYPPRVWRAISRQCRERAGNCCEQCGVKQHSLQIGRRGNPYIIYLVAAHVHPEDPDQPEPIKGQRVRALCPTCHGTYDAEHRRQERQATAAAAREEESAEAA